MLEINHNPDQLQAHKRLIVRNIRRAQADIRKLMDEKRPRGLRVRHSYDFATKSIYLEARSSLMLETVVQMLRASGNVVAADNRRLSWA